MSDPDASPHALAEVLRTLGFAVMRDRMNDADAKKDAWLEWESPPPAWFEEIFGSSDAAAALSSDFLAVFLDQARRHWSQPGDDHEAPSGMWEETGANGSGTNHHLRATAFRAGDGKFIVLESLDATQPDLFRLQQGLHDTSLERRRLEREIQKKTVLLECIVHDLSSPLSTIMLNLQRLGRLTEGNEDARWSIDTAMSQAKRQRNMIHFILEMFSAELKDLLGHHTDPESAPEIGAVATEVYEAQKQLAASAGVALRFENTLAGPARVAGEPTHLARVIDNLVSNAVRHTPRDQTVTIRLAANEAPEARTRGTITLSVEDEGPGVDPSLGTRIFEPLVQGPGSRGKAGVGLHFCKTTVSVWGGRIGYENRDPGGARFWFELPRIEAKSGSGSGTTGGGHP